MTIAHHVDHVHRELIAIHARPDYRGAFCSQLRFEPVRRQYLKLLSLVCNQL
jgi:hypothetical protein